jgi:orotidine-5'-phosphate decarboxylase
VAERIAYLAVESGAEGIIAPATRPDRITALRAIVGARKIYSPGVGVQGGDLERVASLADGVIVGRSIYDHPNPVSVAQNMSRIRR